MFSKTIQMISIPDGSIYWAKEKQLLYKSLIAYNACTTFPLLPSHFF